MPDQPLRQCPRFWLAAPPTRLFRLNAPSGPGYLLLWHCAICRQWHAEISEQRITKNEHRQQED